MTSKTSCDVLVLGAGPGALAIAAAMCQENLRVSVLSANDPREPWPYTYGIWGKEVDDLGLAHLLEHRWVDTVSFFGAGALEPEHAENKATSHQYDYGLFDKRRLQSHWINQCDDSKVKWNIGKADQLNVNHKISIVKTKGGELISSRLVVDATGYEPVFLKSISESSIAIQTCYGVVGKFNRPPVEKGQFVLMDYRCDHLDHTERSQPPSFLYAMDMGNNRFFLEETSLGLAPPMSMEMLKARLGRRLKHRGLEITSLEHEELGLFLPMNKPLPDLTQPILGFGGSASMVHPASGYMVGGLLRRAPIVAKAVAIAINKEGTTSAEIAAAGWKALWPADLRRKQALYQFGLEKLMRFKENQLRDFFISFFGLPSNQWYGFLTNTLTVPELVKAMMKMFANAPWSVRWGLMGMQGREIQLLWKFLKPVKDT